MKTRLIGLATAALIATSAFPATSLAIGLTGSGSAQVEVKEDSTSNNRVGADASMDVEATGGVKDDSRVEKDEGEDDRGLENALIHVTANDAVKAMTVISSRLEVHTNDDFSAYAKGRMKDDTSLRAVDASDASVSASYRAPARFLWVFPTHVMVRADANADGKVRVHYPWYRFLFSMRGNSALSTELAARVKASGETTLTAAEKARLLEEMHAAFSAALDASASGSVSK